MLPTAAYLIVFATFLARDLDKSSWFPHLDFEDVVIPISLHVVMISTLVMVVRVVIFGFPGGGMITPLLLGLAKAMSWYFTLQTVVISLCGLSPKAQVVLTKGLLIQTQYTSWTVASAIINFGMFSSIDPSLLHSDNQALFSCFLALITLSQIIRKLPRKAKAKALLWAFSMVFFVPYLGNVLAI